MGQVPLLCVPSSFPAPGKCLARGSSSKCIFRTPTILRRNYSSSILIFSSQMMAAMSIYLANSAKSSVFTCEKGSHATLWPEFQAVTIMRPQDCVHDQLWVSATLQSTFSDSLSIWYMRKLAPGIQTKNECNFLEVMLRVCGIKFLLQRSILEYKVQMKSFIFLNNFLFYLSKKDMFCGLAV